MLGVTCGMRRRCLLVGLLLVLMLVPRAASADKRIALVITNQAYTQAGAQLINTYRDGDLVTAALQKVGFKVWVARDTASEGAMLQVIGEHARRIAEAGPDTVGFFYYSGHGAADGPNGANYLIPTAVPLTHVSQLPLMAVRLDRITTTLASAGKISFVVFDACRNVPLQRESKDLVFKGFAPFHEQRGLLIAYATEPGNVAIDQSIYAQALAEELIKPGLEAGQVFRAVTRRVLRDTQDRQSPEYLDKRLYDFQFVPSPATPSQPTALLTPAPPPTRCDGVEITVGQDGPRCFNPGAGKTEWFRDLEAGPEMVVVPAGQEAQIQKNKDLETPPRYKTANRYVIEVAI